jgi:hypothetical protein
MKDKNFREFIKEEKGEKYLEELDTEVRQKMKNVFM